jgi:WD40 repeat protein
LIRAGLIPTLQAGLLVQDRDRWGIAIMRPGDQPRYNLAAALVNALPSPRLSVDALTLCKEMQDAGSGAMLGYLAPKLTDNDANLLLVIDQFEELFRFGLDSRDEMRKEEAIDFVALLLALAQQSTLSVYVVLTMRSDFLGRCDAFYRLPEAMNRSQYLVPRLTREQRREAIQGPVLLYGQTISPRLVDCILNDLGDESDQLPVMQHALRLMWDYWRRHAQDGPIDIEHYKAIGTVTEALSRHADEAFARLHDQQQRLAEVIFRCLSEGDTRRPVRLGVAADVAGPGVTPEQVAEVVEVFRHPDYSFITPPVGVSLLPDTMLDISHESLIRQWQKLKQWVLQEAVEAQAYRRLEQTARLWKEDKAALWSTPDLENALAWKERLQPTAAWAERYGSDFALAMEFLDASQQAHEDRRQQEEKRRQQEEEVRQRELQQARKRFRQAIIGLLVIASLAIVTFWALVQAKQATTKAQRAATDAQNATTEAKTQRDNAKNYANAAETERNRAQEVAKQMFELQLQQASGLERIGDYTRANQILLETRKQDPFILPTRYPMRNLMEQLTVLMHWPASPPYEYERAGVRLKKVAVSPDGRWLAAVGEKGKVILLGATDDRKPLRTLPGHTEGTTVNVVLFHPEGEWFATAGDDRRIMRWSVAQAEPKELPDWLAPDQVWALAVNPAGTLLASGGPGTDIILWNSSTGEVVRRLLGGLAGHTASIRGLTFSPDGRWLASASTDFSARIWDLKTSKARPPMKHPDRVEAVAFSPDSQLLATGGWDNRVRLWQVASGRLMQELEGHKNRVSSLVFINSGRHLVSASSDRTLRVWDTNSGVTLRILQNYTGEVNGVVANAKYLFSANANGTIQRWDMPNTGSGQEIRVVQIPSKPTAMTIAPDSTSIAVGFSDGSLRLYTLPAAQLKWEELQASTAAITYLNFSPDGQSIVSGSVPTGRMRTQSGFTLPGGTLTLWQHRNGQLQWQQSWSGVTDKFEAVAFSPDSKLLASAGREDGQIGLFKLGEPTGHFYPAHEKPVLAVVFEADSQGLLSVGSDGSIRSWRLHTWPPARQDIFSPPSAESVERAVFSPDGNRIVRFSSDSLRVSILYRDKNPLKLGEPVPLESSIRQAIFSPTSVQLATLDESNTVLLRDLEGNDVSFALRLPPREPIPGRFDFRCGSVKTPQENCWIAVALFSGHLVLYPLGQLYNQQASEPATTK